MYPSCLSRLATSSPWSFPLSESSSIGDCVPLVSLAIGNTLPSTSVGTATPSVDSIVGMISVIEISSRFSFESKSGPSATKIPVRVFSAAHRSGSVLTLSHHQLPLLSFVIFIALCDIDRYGDHELNRWEIAAIIASKIVLGLINF